MRPWRPRGGGVRLLLLRHGETDWNAAGRYQGSTDTTLSERGQAQARAAAAALSSETLDRILCSPLRRAQETAEAIAGSRPACGEALSPLSIETEPRLAEICFGDWEGLTHTDIARAYPEALRAWRTDPLTCAPPGGETLAQVAARVRQLLEELRHGPAGQSLLLVGHGGSLGVFLSLALGLPPERRWQLRLNHAALSELLLYSEGAILMRHNDTHHLTSLGCPSRAARHRPERARGTAHRAKA
ncbi:MAG: histidine phosphatase family protein [Anaerolineae bacterium]|nr:histidine phosphatase family protein [Anaerolineae bacterium]